MLNFLKKTICSIGIVIGLYGPMINSTNRVFPELNLKSIMNGGLDTHILHDKYGLIDYLNNLKLREKNTYDKQTLCTYMSLIELRDDFLKNKRSGRFSDYLRRHLQENDKPIKCSSGYFYNNNIVISRFGTFFKDRLFWLK